MKVPTWLPTVAFAATFGIFAVDKWSAFTAVASSGRGLVVVAVIVGGYLAARHLVERHWAGPLVMTVVVLGLAAWIVRPYYTERRVEQELVPGQVVDAAPTTTVGSQVATSAPPEGPVRLSSGPLVGTDHDAAGDVSVVRAPDGAVVIRFADFSVEGTPDPRLYLVPAPDATDTGDGVELGSFTGTSGTLFDVAVPTDVDVGAGWTVLLWCRAFGVPIAFATQSAPP